MATSTKFLGHHDKVEAFRKLAHDGELGHAYLFFGDVGIGKHTFARRFAHFLEWGTFEENDALLLDARFLAPHESGSIGIDAVRELKSFLWQTPLRSPRRTVVIDGAEAMTPEAQGSVLKIVEEPPPHALIILIAPDPQAFTAPLRSRLFKVYFRRFSHTDLEEALVTYHKVPRARAREIAERSFGRIGRALTLLIKPAPPAADTPLTTTLEERIVSLWRRGVGKHSGALSYLLMRATYLRRYNLNEGLQEKAIDHTLETLIS